MSVHAASLHPQWSSTVASDKLTSDAMLLMLRAVRALLTAGAESEACLYRLAEGAITSNDAHMPRS